jgi:GxxExxY protein
MNRIERQRLISILTDAATEVYTTLGRGLSLLLYKECFLHELKSKSVNYREDVVIPLNYKGFKPETLIKIEILAENEIPVEIVNSASTDQTLMNSLIRLANKDNGLIINFAVQQPEELVVKTSLKNP